MNYKDQIEAYVANRLSAEERSAFEKQMKADAELRNEVELEQMANLLIDEVVKEDVAGQIKRIRSTGNTQKTTVIRRLYWAIPVAATVAILIGVFLFNSGDQDPVLFAQDQYSLYQPNFSNQRGDNSQEDVQSLLEAGKGEEAEAALLDGGSNNSYLLGHAYFIQGKYSDALSSFQASDVANKEEASFYSALTMLALNRTEEGLNSLRQIVEQEDHQFRVLAQKVLKNWQ